MDVWMPWTSMRKCAASSDIPIDTSTHSAIMDAHQANRRLNVAQEINVIETIEAPFMGARIIEEKCYPYGFNIQYEYAREGRAKLYGGVQTQQWRTIGYDGHGGREGPKSFATVAKARAAAKRVVANNNGGSK